jgi:hypothetical protein
MLLSWSSRVTTTSSPACHERAREVEAQLRGAAPEHDAGGIGAEQIGHRLASLGDGSFGALLCRGDGSTVGDGGCQRAGHRRPDDVRNLRAARPVEVGHSFGQRREVAADPLDVERHQSVRLSMRSPIQS